MCCPVQLNAALFHVSKPSPSKLDLSHLGQEDYLHKSITPVAENFWFLISVSSFFIPSLFSVSWAHNTLCFLAVWCYCLLFVEDTLKQVLSCLVEEYPRREWDPTGKKTSPVFNEFIQWHLQHFWRFSGCTAKDAQSLHLSARLIRVSRKQTGVVTSTLLCTLIPGDLNLLPLGRYRKAGTHFNKWSSVFALTVGKLFIAL